MPVHVCTGITSLTGNKMPHQSAHQICYLDIFIAMCVDVQGRVSTVLSMIALGSHSGNPLLCTMHLNCSIALHLYVHLEKWEGYGVEDVDVLERNRRAEVSSHNSRHRWRVGA